MKKFEDELRDNNLEILVSNTGSSLYGQSYVNYDKVVELSEGWVPGEDYQQVAKALGNTTDKLACAEERVGLLEKTVDKLKSQLEKQQPEIPEVPQFVADWYEENKGSLDYMIFETCRDLTDESTNEFENWFGYDENKAITTLVNMKNGYTVAKEKRFYLKNKLTGLYLYESKKGFFEQEKLALELTSRCDYSQQEIDSMAADSYEKIEVGDD